MSVRRFALGVQRTDHGKGKTERQTQNVRRSGLARKQTLNKGFAGGGGESREVNSHKILMTFETVTGLLVISNEGRDDGHRERVKD